jgi:hypothetical protein
LDISIEEIDEEIIKDLLSNFVICEETSEGRRYFRFAHLSVREFLEGRLEYCAESSNTFAAEVCLLTLIGSSGSPDVDFFLRELGIGTATSATLPAIESYKKGIHDYSLQYWSFHCQYAGEESRAVTTSRLRTLFHYFLFDDSNESCPLNYWVLSRERRKAVMVYQYDFERSFEIYHQSRDRAFFIACAFGFRDVVTMDLYHELDDDVKETCILIATEYHQYEILKFLLDITNNRKLRQVLIKFLEYAQDPGVLKWLLTLIEPAQVT